jgi:hypothetical protein
LTGELGLVTCEDPSIGAQARDLVPDLVAALCDLAMRHIEKQLDQQNTNPL